MTGMLVLTGKGLGDKSEDLRAAAGAKNFVDQWFTLIRQDTLQSQENREN